MPLNTFRRKKAEILEAIAAYNRKYNFSSREIRSNTDQLEFDLLWKELILLEYQFDLNHPIPPCEKCGKERRASLEGLCLNCNSEYLGG